MHSAVEQCMQSLLHACLGPSVVVGAALVGLGVVLAVVLEGVGVGLELVPGVAGRRAELLHLVPRGRALPAHRVARARILRLLNALRYLVGDVGRSRRGARGEHRAALATKKREEPRMRPLRPGELCLRGDRPCGGKSHAGSSCCRHEHAPPLAVGPDDSTVAKPRYAAVPVRE
ncbi:unnamed protein product [Musa acuminata subsp. burmannicoides]